MPTGPYPRKANSYQLTTITHLSMIKRDIYLSLLSGLLIGILAMSVLSVARLDADTDHAYVVIPSCLIGIPVLLAGLNEISRKLPVLWELGIFSVIGTLNTLVDWGTLVLLIILFRKCCSLEPVHVLAAGIPVYALYKSVSFLVSVVNSYLWNKYWTFFGRPPRAINRQLLEFGIASAIGFGINVGLSTFVFSQFRLGQLTTDQWGLVAAGAGTLCGMTWNFLSYKIIVFRG